MLHSIAMSTGPKDYGTFAMHVKTLYTDQSHAVEFRTM